MPAAACRQGLHARACVRCKHGWSFKLACTQEREKRNNSKYGPQLDRCDTAMSHCHAHRSSASTCSKMSISKESGSDSNVAAPLVAWRLLLPAGSGRLGGIAAWGASPRRAEAGRQSAKRHS